MWHYIATPTSDLTEPTYTDTQKSSEKSKKIKKEPSDKSNLQFPRQMVDARELRNSFSIWYTGFGRPRSNYAVMWPL